MHPVHSFRHHVIVVGSRVAGASTALLLARRGYRVLLVDRRQPDSDTLSTHGLMRAGVLQLKRWGLLDQVIDSGAPAVSRTIVNYGDEAEVIELKTRAGVAELYAPRRFVLDSILARAAAEEGVDVRFGTTVCGLLTDASGAVCGVYGRDREGRGFEEHAVFTVGADGLNSRVAREVRAPILHRGRGASGMIYGYWSGLTTEHYDWFYRPGLAAGIIPTNDGEACVWVSAPARRFMESLRWDLDRSFHTLLEEAAPLAAERLRTARRSGRLRGFHGAPGFLRQPWGEGWALVGDASHFKDPISAHGITDALRDADFLTEAIDAVLGGRTREREAFGAYQHLRDRLSLPLFALADEIASYGWDLAELRGLLVAMSRAMKEEVEALEDLATCPTASAA
jgi:flavin-dependent dehydrogenase